MFTLSTFQPSLVSMSWTSMRTSSAAPTPSKTRRLTGRELTGASASRMDSRSWSKVGGSWLGDGADSGAVDRLARVPQVDVGRRTLRHVRLAGRLLRRQQLDPEPLQAVEAGQDHLPHSVEEVMVELEHGVEVRQMLRFGQSRVDHGEV